MSDADLQRAIRDALLAENPDFSQLPPRVAIYRRLVRNTLTDVVCKILPRTRERMGQAFDDAFARFLAEHAPRTHYLRDVPREFIEWARPQWIATNIEPWLIDLAHHELTYFSVATVPHLPEPRAEEVSLDKSLLLSSLVRIERYAFAVHEDFPAGSAPAKRDLTLLYYRDERHALAMLEISALATSLLLHVNLSLQNAIAVACKEASVPMNDDTLASIARLLADLGERGVLLGAQEPQIQEPNIKD